MLPTMFVDNIKIFAKAGDGGNGCVSFRREKYVDRGGPDGGDGGDGGDVVLIADKNVSDLSDLFFNSRLVTKPGGHGRGTNCTGRNSPDVVVRVPVGTQVFSLSRPARLVAPTRYHPGASTEEFDVDAKVGMQYCAKNSPAGGARFHTPEPATAGGLAEASPAEEPPELIADLVEDGQRFILAHGGRGGRGNFHFKSSTHQAPREFEYGEPGEQLRVALELKTIADVGLVGYPNAGKSTLLAKLTKAHPKIAPYPFTTLTPNVGSTDYEDYERITIADIPGLIEDAHAGKGLGHAFLRHIERCRLLLILLDMAGVDGRDPREDYRQLLEELKLHNPELLKKPRLVVANKMDLPDAAKKLTAFKRSVARASSPSLAGRISKTGRMPVLRISALESEGLDELKVALRAALA
jgi:GTP-binding protein